ncbi:serine/threonine-protein kinase [Rhodohalobacter sulfatireducens]|uniref:Protein kinase n=1 Tax=Rhodohalobacter sulfatireducens TaxID=2911366 RepID=A0ABS9KFE4_9BACT|nr:serine/threonine-protein kinase [Rhodohalobacter sulfatireducens]MCG2589569.1 protein kinase [Rhodohalobacter sulfatireducens]
MNDDRIKRIEILLEQALALPKDKRDAFINHECGADEELLSEVRSLLKNSNRAFEFIKNVSREIVPSSASKLSKTMVRMKDRENTIIRHYHIIEEVGRGGMGIVYKADDVHLNRTVALKFLSTHLTKGRDDKQLLIREARAAAALNHPNICTVYSIEKHEDQYFIAMEYIEGETLETKLENQTLTIQSALRYGIQIAEALTEAHDKDVIHRDIKPGNIMVDSKNRIKVTDFGLAEIKNGSAIGESGPVVGTAAYMSPEQIYGNKVDHRTDLFSFGIILFEMLTGKRPFQAEYDAALTYSILNENPPSLFDLLRDIPQELSQLVSRLLEKNPDARYRSAKEVLKDLKTCQKQLSNSTQESQLKKLSGADSKLTLHKSGIKNPLSYGFADVDLGLPQLGFNKITAILSVGLIILLLIGYNIFSSFNATNLPSDQTLAVLPLESINQDPEDIKFADGFHEELINRLAGISDLTVISRRSVLDYPPGGRDLQAIGEKLDVSALMDGTIRRSGDRIRVSVQLIDVNSLATVWSESFDENVDDIFTMQSRIARQVAGQLQASLTEEEQERLLEKPTDNLFAYLLYMRGQDYLGRFSLEGENLLEAEQLFNNALKEDHRFTHAWTSLTQTYFLLYWFHGRNPEHLELMKETADHAYLLNPNLPETQVAIGMYRFWAATDHEQTLAHFEKALQRFPNHYYLHSMTALTHRRLGNWELMIYHLNKAFELNPLAPGNYTEFSWDYWLLRDYERAEYYLYRLNELKLDTQLSYHWYARLQLSKEGTLEGFERWWGNIQPEDPAVAEPRWWGEYNAKKRNWQEAIRGYRNVDDELVENSQAQYLFRDYLIGLCLEFQGHSVEAQNYYEHVKNQLEILRDQHPEEPRYRAELGKVYAHLGEIEKAIYEGKKATELIPVSQNAHVGPFFEIALAEIYAWTGYEEEAIDKLEYLLSIPSRAHRNDLRFEPAWDPLRDNPRFQELISKEDEPYLDRL